MGTTTKNTKQIVRFNVTAFPKGTTEIYICGDCPELGDWDARRALQLQYYQNDGEGESFYIEIPFEIGREIKYKYLNYRNWECVECGFVAQDIDDRSITIKNNGKVRTVNDEIRGFRIP